MRYTIEIDDRTKAGKSLLELAREIGKNLKSVKIFAQDEEVREERAIVRMIEEGLKSGLVDEEEVLKELGIK